MLISHKVKSTIQKVRIGFGEMDIAGRFFRTGISLQYKVPVNEWREPLF
ncbi:MAG: hypothetical protein AVDCRST_MAG96-490 [uncultured Segetibacter sp.]|uniref:Uncharacterized protein n=1 Tax=uncultured Segetibacter sp. TaxID=481133 RepID=A0A6J4RGQ0_9BACT|nr:MAG: hypothetical protein AVDCRST_MAG96-490 [uncultured Segetibacter sp.]